jgi:hypothetical protein
MPTGVPISIRPMGEGRSRYLPITDGEIHFLWWFIQGSIMDLRPGMRFYAPMVFVSGTPGRTSTSRSLSGAALVRASDSLSRADRADTSDHSGSPIDPPIAAATAQSRRPMSAVCIDCAGTGAAPRARLDRGGDSGGLRSVATELVAFWRTQVCAICAGDGDQAFASLAAARIFWLI